MPRSSKRVPIIVATAVGAAALLGTCVTDRGQSRPADPRAEGSRPSQAQSPPFTASIPPEATQPDPSSLPILEGQVVQQNETSVTVRGDTGELVRMEITPDTVVRTELQPGERVRAAWALDEEDGFSAISIIPVEEAESPAQPQESPEVGPTR